PRTAAKQTKPAAAPMRSAPQGSTKPDAGVMVAKPATAPVAAPIVVARPWRRRSAIIQASIAAAAPNCVLTNALEASPLAAKALPALKPNHPNHRIPAPRITSGTLWGAWDAEPYPRRLPR